MVKVTLEAAEVERTRRSAGDGMLIVIILLICY